MPSESGTVIPVKFIISKPKSEQLKLFKSYSICPSIDCCAKVFKYSIIALILNSVLFTVNFIGMVTNKTYRLELLKTCGIQLINIPVAVLYFY